MDNSTTLRKSFPYLSMWGAVVPSSKGSIGLQCAPTPIFFRNITVEKPLRPQHLELEKVAKSLAKVWEEAEIVRKQAEERKRQVELAERKLEEERERQRANQRLSLLDALRAAVKSDTSVEVVAKLDAKALPYPKDARDLKFNTTFGMIDFKSGSSLNALAAFYLREMANRGWVEDESAATLDEDSLELMFEAGDAEFELELDQRSDYVDVSIDTEEVDFAGTNDPASLAALGIPQPRKALLLQQEVPIPADAQRLTFDDDGCMFFSTMKVQEAFAHFGNIIRQKGYRESRDRSFRITGTTRNFSEEGWNSALTSLPTKLVRGSCWNTTMTRETRQSHPWRKSHSATSLGLFHRVLRAGGTLRRICRQAASVRRFPVGRCLTSQVTKDPQRFF